MFIVYAEHIERMTLFRRNKCPPMWNTLFSILKRALTCNVGGLDHSSHAILAIMYGIYFDLPLDYHNLIYEEMTSAIEAKVELQRKGTQPKYISFGRFFGVLMGYQSVGDGSNKLPIVERPFRINEMRYHHPTINSKGYPNTRLLPSKMLTYLGKAEDRIEYKHGNRTP